MKIGAFQRPTVTVRTVPLAEAPLKDTYNFKRHEMFGKWSLSEKADEEFAYPGIVWSRDLDPSPERSVRESEEEQPMDYVSSMRRVIDAVAGETPTVPKRVSILMESRLGDAEQFSDFSQSVWKDGRPISILEHETRGGKFEMSRQIFLNAESETLTIITTSNPSEQS